MTKVFALFLLCLSYLYVEAQSEFNYTISLNLQQSPTPVLLLVEYELDGVKQTDSLFFNESVSVITKTLEQPVAASLRQSSDIEAIQVFLANNQFNIIVERGKIITKPYVFEEEFLLLSENDRIRPQYFPLYGELNARNDSIGLKKLSVIFDSLRLDDITKAKKYFESHNNSLLSLYAFNRFASFSGDYSTLGQDFNKLPVWAKESPDGKSIRAKINGATSTKIGATAKDFEQRSFTGNVVRLSDYKGKYVLLDFWASWCGPCRKEHPGLLKAYEIFKTKNFEIISISLDNNKQAWVKAIEKDGLLWPNISDLKGMQNEVAILYGVQSIPANFLINPDGKIINIGLSGSDLSEILNKLDGIK
jgi:peroxiredoxin